MRGLRIGRNLLDMQLLYRQRSEHSRPKSRGGTPQILQSSVSPANAERTFQAVGEIHLAGYHVNTLEDGREVWIDTHGYPVYDALWAFYRDAIQKFGPITTLVEWDTDIPKLNALVAEARKADAICTEVLKAA